MAKSKKGRNSAKPPVAKGLPPIARSTYRIMVGIALAFSALMMSPLLRSAFLGDDADNSFITPSGMAVMHTSLSKLIGETFVRWATVEGRFYPLSLYVQNLFYAVNGNRLLFKFIMLALTLACVGLFSWLVRRITRSDAMGLAAAFVPTLVFQFMYYYDALLGFAGLLQVVAIYVLGSLLLFSFYLDNGRRWFLVGSVALYVASLLTYEMTFPFFLLYALLAWFYPEKRSYKEVAKKAAPFAIAAVALAIGLVVLRMVMHVGVTAAGAAPSPYQISLDPGQYLRALAIQIVGALPLSYSTFGSGTWGRTGLFASPWAYLAKYPLTSLLAFIGYAGLTGLAAWLTRREMTRRDERKSLWPLAAFGAALLVLSGAMIALSPRWHTELAWGVAYIPVFVAYFGSAVLLVVGGYALFRASGRGNAGIAVAVALCLVAGFVGMANLQNNRLVISEWDSWRFGREMMGDVTSRGAFGIKDGAVLIVNNRINNRQPWDVPQFYQDNGVSFSAVMAASTLDVKALKKAATASTTTTGGAEQLTFDGPKPVMYVDYSADAASGYAVIARVSSVTLSGTTISDIGMTTEAAYLKGPSTPSLDSLWGPAKTLLPAITLESVGVNPAEFAVAESGPDWQLYKRR